VPSNIAEPLPNCLNETSTCASPFALTVCGALPPRAESGNDVLASAPSQWSNSTRSSSSWPVDDDELTDVDDSDVELEVGSARVDDDESDVELEVGSASVEDEDDSDEDEDSAATIEDEDRDDDGDEDDDKDDDGDEDEDRDDDGDDDDGDEDEDDEDDSDDDEEDDDEEDCVENGSSVIANVAASPLR
jgi:hypothetical protein